MGPGRAVLIVTPTFLVCKWVRHKVLQACGAQQPPNCLQGEPGPGGPAYSSLALASALGAASAQPGEVAFLFPPTASNVGVSCCAQSRNPD